MNAIDRSSINAIARSLQFVTDSQVISDACASYARKHHLDSARVYRAVSERIDALEAQEQALYSEFDYQIEQDKLFCEQLKTNDNLFHLI